MCQLTLHNVSIPQSCLAPSSHANPSGPNDSPQPSSLVEGTIRCSGAKITSVGLHPNANPSSELAAHGTQPNAVGEAVDGTGYYALPGFIDIHIHGGMGADAMDGSAEALQTVARFLVQHGVTSFCPTTMTAPHSEIRAALDAVRHAQSRGKAAIENNEPIRGARILGCHVEGPYISPQYPGAQPADYIRPPDLSEFRELVELGPVRLITLAPEAPNADKLIALALEHGVVVVVGHTNATYEECVTAVNLGATQATHTYNAMSGLHHREPGTVGAVLTIDSLSAQLIADNVHVHPAAMQVLYQCKGHQGIILISDAMRAAGLAEGQYSLGGQDVFVQQGTCRLADGTLAGSVLTLDEALRSYMAATSSSLYEAWPATSRNAARSLGMADALGSIAPGYWADIVLLDADFRVAATIVAGQLVYNTNVPTL